MERARATASAEGPGRSRPEYLPFLRSVEHAERPHECELPGDEHDGGEDEKDPRLAHRDSSLSAPAGALLEANVLQGFGRLPVQPRGLAVVVSLLGEIAERDPGGGPVTDRSQLLEAPIGGAEEVLSLLQAILLNQGTPERQLGGADLGEVIE